MLQIKNLSCARNENILFGNVSFALQHGEALQIIGPNGSGKTTLLRTIAGFLRPAVGKIELNNPGICYVGHKSGLHPDLTVQQNLEFLQTLDHARPVTNIIESALDYFALKNKQYVKCAELSAGQMQRVSLARLCVTTAKLWLLDEPLANLDTQASALLCTLCVKHLQNHGTIVVATHNLLNFDPVTLATIQLANYG